MRYWRAIQRENFTDVDKLVEYTQIDPSEVEITSQFPLNMPLRLARKVEKGNRMDPILIQFLPSTDERKRALGFVDDPVGDRASALSRNLIKKYAGRALLLTTGACGMNCRFCFRQNYPYGGKTHLMQALERIQGDPSLFEIILSGGDPLSLSDSALCNLIHSLEAISHLKFLRIHTRFPIGIPERITDQLVSCVQASRLKVIVILHINHPRELDTGVTTALKKLHCLLFSHTVLLKGVNNNAAVLKQLFLKLIYDDIVPYYLNQLDPVKQASHFHVPIEEGVALMQTLRSTLPGYALPTYVQEIPGSSSKTPVEYIGRGR